MGKIVGDVIFYASVIFIIVFLAYCAIMLAYNLYELFFSKIPTQEGIIIKRRMKKNAGKFNIN